MRRSTTLGSLALAACLGGFGCVGSPSAPNEEPPSTAELLAEALDLHEAKEFGPAAALAARLTTQELEPEQRETALFLLAECRFQLGMFESAYESFLRLAKECPTSRALTLVPNRIYLIGKEWTDYPRVFFFGIQVDRAPGIEALSRVVVDFPRSVWADDAWMSLAKAHHDDGDHDLAALAYENLRRDQPRSEHLEEATIGAAREYESISRGPHYDAEPLLRARQAAVRYLKEYGADGRFTDEAIEIIQSLTDAVAASERSIAAYYRERGIEVGERLHDTNARRLLGETDDLEVGLDSTELLRPRIDRPIWRSNGDLPPLLDARIERNVPTKGASAVPPAGG